MKDASKKQDRNRSRSKDETGDYIDKVNEERKSGAGPESHSVTHPIHLLRAPSWHLLITSFIVDPRTLFCFICPALVISTSLTALEWP